MEEQLKYPVGRFVAPTHYTKELLTGCIDDIRNLPAILEKEIQSLNDAQLDTPYRLNGWTVRQVVHHFADSHMNALIRVKLAATENQNPTILPYNQDLWSTLPDSKLPIGASLNILKGIHQRWIELLMNFNDQTWEKGYVHPEKGRLITLKESTASYSWHCRHHVAHITSLKKRMNWD